MTIGSELFEETRKESGSTVMKLDPDRKICSGSFERKVELAKDKKNVFNSNNGVFNIYDENGSCFITADAELVQNLTKEHKDLKKDETLGVELSNGMNFSNATDAEKWNVVQRTGEMRTNAVHKAEREKAEKLKSLRGTAKTAPTPVKQTELSPELAASKAKGMENA